MKIWLWTSWISVREYTHSRRWVRKLYFVAIPTSSGTGSEVTPFAIITDAETGVKWPIADYELLPNMAIVDADNHDDSAKGTDQCIRYRCSDTCDLEAYVSIMATDYTDGLAIKASEEWYLNTCQMHMRTEQMIRSQEKRWLMLPAMAGMAFANAFLGV